MVRNFIAPKWKTASAYKKGGLQFVQAIQNLTTGRQNPPITFSKSNFFDSRDYSNKKRPLQKGNGRFFKKNHQRHPPPRAL